MLVFNGCVSHESLVKPQLLPYVWDMCMTFCSQRTGSYRRKDSRIFGRQVIMCCWNGLQGMVSRSQRWHAVEEVDRAYGAHRLSVEGSVWKEGLVSVPDSITVCMVLVLQHSGGWKCSVGLKVSLSKTVLEALKNSWDDSTNILANMLPSCGHHVTIVLVDMLVKTFLICFTPFS